jgi:hypothetical protein
MASKGDETDRKLLKLPAKNKTSKGHYKNLIKKR